MELDTALDIGRGALHLALLASAPILAIGLVVGLIISIIQAVTQLQEQTLTFVPKIAAMVIAASVLTPWIATLMLDYSREMFGTFP
jgi:flagellar biosynthetic protein FliQ